MPNRMDIEQGHVEQGHVEGEDRLTDSQREVAYELANQLRERLVWASTPQGEEHWEQVYTDLMRMALPPAPVGLEVVSQTDGKVALNVRAWDRDVDSAVCDFSVSPIVVSNSKGRSCRMTPAQARDMAAKLVELADWAEGQ